MKLVGIITAILLIFAFALPAYAETQSVRVSGDLTIRGIHRDEFDLNKNGPSEDEDFLMTTAEVQIDADLTDNVSTVIRIVNQRNWGDSDYRSLTREHLSTGTTAYNLDLGHSLLDLGVDLAYVQIKELIFQPVTLKLGRQDLWFGRGLVIGANQVDPGQISAIIAGVNLGTSRGIGSPELTAFNAFDAARLTIDFEQYAPFVVDLVYFKNDEGDIDAEDDVNVWGVNMAYDWDVYNAETEAYCWLKLDGTNTSQSTTLGGYDELYTIGARGSFVPHEDAVFGAEAAVQLGDYVGNANQPQRKRLGYLLNAYVDYLGWTKYLYSPKLGAEYLFLSGDHNVGKGDDLKAGWDAMYRGYYPLLIRPFQGYYYMTGRFPLGSDLGLTNQHAFILKGSLQPLDDVKFEATAAKYYFDEEALQGGTGHDIGTELDLMTTYDYTEDVTFSLLTAWFFPGKVYDNENPANNGVADLNPETATEVIGSCKVSF